jgi:hypothetical protein
VREMAVRPAASALLADEYLSPDKWLNLARSGLGSSLDPAARRRRLAVLCDLME